MSFRVTQAAARLDINTVQDTTATLQSLCVPHGMEFDVVLNVRVLNPVGSACICITHPKELHVPAFSTAPFGALGTGVANASAVGQVHVRTDSLGRVRLVSNSTGGVTVQASTVSFKPASKPKPSPFVWDSRVIFAGGRIDSMCDLGCGVFVAGGRGSIMGKMFRSTDYGETWTLVQQLLTSTGISTIKARDGIAYALSEDSRIWKSVDAGATWVFMKQIPTGPGVGTNTRSYGLCVLPSGTVLVADCSAHGHIWRSTDCVANFTDIGAVGTNALYRLQDVGDGVLVNGWAGNCWKSTDDGLTWSSRYVAEGALYGIEYAGCGVVYMGTDRGQVLRSDDNGDTWKHVGLTEAESDDFAVIDGTVVHSTYTASRDLYVIGESSVTNIGQAPTSGWLDHVIGSVDACGCPMLIGGTSDGLILRGRKA